MPLFTSQLAHILSDVRNREISPVEAFTQIDEYVVGMENVLNILSDVRNHKVSTDDAIELLCDYCTVIDD